MRLTTVLCFVFFLVARNFVQAQQVHGSLQANANIFIRDSLIGAADIPQYDRQKFGGESWLNLSYSNWGFDFTLRYDFFGNSNLLNPTDSYSDQGIGFWQVSKQIDELHITGGYFYDQIGSGILFRAYEQRPLLIDNALIGVRLRYDLSENWFVKGFAGRQKRQFDTYVPLVAGFNIEGFLSDPIGGWSLAPGLGFINRGLDDATMDALVAVINTYPPEEAFVPKWNTYGLSLYNTLVAGPFTWYVEGAYKTEEAINDPFAEIQLNDSTTIIGDRFIQEPGSVVYTSLSYASKGIGITLEGKRTENFVFRIRPQEQLNRGLMSFSPPMTRVNTYRLPSRYNAATQELGEWAFQGDVVWSPGKSWRFNLNVSNLTRLDGDQLYREIYAEAQYKIGRDWRFTGGIQRQLYNQSVYEFKPNVPNVETITPFADVQYRFNRNTALRVELQYMAVGEDEVSDAGQDYGDWVFALAELTLAPNWTFSVSDMYNIQPGRESPVDIDGTQPRLHYPRVDVSYVRGSNRFEFSYVKQVEGVVCTGGICRLEPAFSGFKFGVNTTF